MKLQIRDNAVKLSNQNLIFLIYFHLFSSFYMRTWIVGKGRLWVRRIVLMNVI